MGQIWNSGSIHRTAGYPVRTYSQRVRSRSIPFAIAAAAKDVRRRVRALEGRSSGASSRRGGPPDRGAKRPTPPATLCVVRPSRMPNSVSRSRSSIRTGRSPSAAAIVRAVSCARTCGHRAMTKSVRVVRLPAGLRTSDPGPTPVPYPAATAGYRRRVPGIRCGWHRWRASRPARSCWRFRHAGRSTEGQAM